MTPALFAALAAVLVVSSLMVILHRNAVASALFLVLSFCCLAGIYLLLGAEFIGLVQVVVYAGAIMVLFLFVIMYLNLGRDVETGAQIALRRGLGWIVGALIVVTGVVILRRHLPLGPEDLGGTPAPGNTQSLGVILYTRSLFPFEITSIVLLVAMVGAVVIARGRPPARRGRAGAAVAPAMAASAAPGTPPAPASSAAPEEGGS